MSTNRAGTPRARAHRARTSKPGGMAAANSSPLGTASSENRANRTELERGKVPLRLPLAQRSRTATKVARLEGRLFDDEGHLRQGLSDKAVNRRLGEINDLRRDLGWLSLDVHHHYVWPAAVAS
jgi:hypothetical protein